MIKASFGAFFSGLGKKKEEGRATFLWVGFLGCLRKARVRVAGVVRHVLRMGWRGAAPMRWELMRGERVFFSRGLRPTKRSQRCSRASKERAGWVFGGTMMPPYL